MERYIWETPEETALALAKRLRGIRKRRRISQEQLSERSGVSYGSIRRFESSGQISFVSLIRLAAALGCLNEIRSLFTDVAYLSIEEVKNERS